MISELAKQVEKSSTAPKRATAQKAKLILPSAKDEQVKKLLAMFPTATPLIIEQMIQIYLGREGLIKAALISLGYKRSTGTTLKPGETANAMMLMMAKPSSKKLYDKLAGYFPDKSEELIKNLMFQHKEIEHEIISALVGRDASSVRGRTTTQRSRATDETVMHDKNGSIMKLRYLKNLFPSCEEVELYHLLYRNDLNAQKVVDEVEKRGHKKANIQKLSDERGKSKSKIKAAKAAKIAADKLPFKDPVVAHRARTKTKVDDSRLAFLVGNLKKHFETQPDEVLKNALEATDYDEKLAKLFLEEMKPINEEDFKRRFKLSQNEGPRDVLFPCKAIQVCGPDSATNWNLCNEHVAISMNIINCKTALALPKVDAATFTGNDLEPIKRTLALGRSPSLAIGPVHQAAIGANSGNRPKRSLGADSSRRLGSHYNEICCDETRPRPNGLARGTNPMLAIGRSGKLQLGHNPKLVQRIHPFFVKKQQQHYGELSPTIT